MDAYTLTLYDDAGNPIPIPAIQGIGIKEIRLKEAGEVEDIYEIVLDDERVYTFVVKHGRTVQPDWDQNDSTADDYIKNKPFGVGGLVEKVLIEEQTVTIGEEFFAQLNGSLFFDIGKTYTVTFNGTKYECTAREWSDNSAVMIGNGAIYGDGNSSNDEPFSIDSYGEGDIFLNTRDVGDYTISISAMVEDVRKIDEKYMPDRVLEGSLEAIGKAELALRKVNELGASLKWVEVPRKNDESTYLKPSTESFLEPGDSCEVSTDREYYESLLSGLPIGSSIYAPFEYITLNGQHKNGWITLTKVTSSKCIGGAWAFDGMTYPAYFHIVLSVSASGSSEYIRAC